MDVAVFLPGRRLGILFQLIAILLLGGAAAYGLWSASQADIGPLFLLYLSPALLSIFAVPLLAYRLYALQSAGYTLERDGIHLRWGLRIEDIPMTQVLWVSAAQEVSPSPPLPWLRWPGAVLGVRHSPARHVAKQDTSGAQDVEFLASSSRGLVLIATPQRIFAISPNHPEAFLSAFDRFIEMGSLDPAAARSVYPALLVFRVWAARPARSLLIASLVLSLLLLIWVSLAIPAREQVRLGFLPNGEPGEAVPAVRLLLLPVISGLFVVVDWFAGLFLFRRADTENLAYLLWANSVLAPALSLIAVFFVLSSA
jgi:hypothetical protein